MYYADRVELQNHAEAAKWLRLAADEGDPSTQFFLAVMYNFGEGVPKNSVNALMCSIWQRRMINRRQRLLAFMSGERHQRRLPRRRNLHALGSQNVDTQMRKWSCYPMCRPQTKAHKVARSQPSMTCLVLRSVSHDEYQLFNTYLGTNHW